MRTCTLLSGCVLSAMTGHGSPARAQSGGWLVGGTAIVSRASPVANIHVFAWFDYVPGVAELFSVSVFDLLVTEPRMLDYYNPPGITGWPAPVLPTSIPELLVGQVHFPPNLPGNPANPLLVVVARWQTDDFTPRQVTVSAIPRFGFTVYRSLSSLGEYTIPDPQGGEYCIQVLGDCDADCDASTGVGVLDIFDFLCFQNHYVSGHAYACDCDTGTGPGLCDIFDFLCFQNAFAAGCP